MEKQIVLHKVSNFENKLFRFETLYENFEGSCPLFNTDTELNFTATPNFRYVPILFCFHLVQKLIIFLQDVSFKNLILPKRRHLFSSV